MAVRLSRSERYGQLTCGACSKRQRDEFRCVLKGHEREPAKAPAYKVPMGGVRKPEFFRSCPVGTVLTDSVAELMTAYNVYKSFGSEWLPGRRSPRLLEAFVIIEREHNLITLEETKTE